MRFLENSFWNQLLRIAIAAPLGLLLVRIFKPGGILQFVFFFGIYIVVSLVFEALRGSKTEK